MAASSAWTGIRPLATSCPPERRTAEPNGAAQVFPTSTAAELPGSIGQLERFDAAVVVLLQDEQVVDPYHSTVDEVAQRRRDLTVELATGELHHDPVHRTQLVETALPYVIFVH